MLQRAYLPAVLVAVSLHTVAAQDRASTLEPGTRVRITAPNLGLEKQQGTFEALRGDTLVMMADSSLSFPVGSITRFDVSRGRKGFSWAGGGIGFLVGAAAGVGVAAVAFNDDYGSPCSTKDGPTSCAVVVTGSVILGTLLGGFLLLRGERWEEMPLDRLRVSLVPQRGGFGLGARIAF